MAGVPFDCGVAVGYGNEPYGIIAYAGSELCDPVSGVPGPGSNVIDNLDISRNRLGCGVVDVFVTARCGEGVTCVLDGVTTVAYDRRLDDVSEARVIIDLGGDVQATCCACLPDVEPWCHELHIWRDGEEAWVGPIQEITYSYSQIEIKAKDSLAWLGVRIPPIDIDFTVSTTDVVDIADFVIDTAFAEEAPTCELDNVYEELSGIETLWFTEAFQQTALEILRDLADAGLNYTTLGRTIVLTGDTTPLTPLVLLNDEHIIGNVQITKDGTLQGNRWFVHFDGDGGTPASGEASDFFCYGPIERLRDGDGLTNGVDAGQVADIYAAAAAITPRIMEVPAGSQLAPDTPWNFQDMVPGARVDVAIVKTCFQLTQSFRLERVEVQYTDSGEQVNITLTPIDSVATE